MPTKSANNAVELSYINYIASNNSLNFTATPISGGAAIIDATAGVYANGAFVQANAAFNAANSINVYGANTTSNSYFSIPIGTTAERPASAANGAIRYNTTLGRIEGYLSLDGWQGVGFRNVPINSQSAAYTTVLSDSGKVIFHPSTDTNARTFTIDSNANVAYEVGTVITFINMASQVVTIAITSDTLYLSGTGSTGNRSLAQYGMATAIKMTSTTWIISGNGIT